MPIYQAIVLAIVQGLGEFIPISSSGHLIIVRRLLGWNELSPSGELTFDVALHFGTLLSVLFYFRRTWFQIIRAALGGKVVRFSESGSADTNLAPEEQKEERLLLWFLAIATIPGAIAGKLLEHSAEDYFREHVVLIAAALIVVALLMWLGEKTGSLSKPLTRISLADSLIIGVAQAFALIPGVSRSGSTITAGLFRGMTREAAVRFSFLLSTPIIAGAALLKAHELHKEGLPAGMHAPFLVGILVSALVGYAAIAWLIRYLQSNSLRAFIIYRIVAGVVVIGLAYVWHLQ
ncbi:Undecaprenyl-diphosphatase [Candidatus Sulfotelmatobacter kueseliae]|uniref:Undecaprenyl-diphosphatase n=1 Tax=Candidatus Sulfotelmatobacter kueseliae TaxID=2042962 RepID=A0A2U3K8K9_9BACT|nr:Undecaprenyl-diphosphatase [Candidatus Sulfotelmatobacter kueseliae]